MGVSCFFRKVQPAFLTIGSGRPKEMIPGFCVFSVFLQKEVEATNRRQKGIIFQTRTIRSLELDQSGPGKDLKEPKLAAEVQRARY